MEGAGGRSIFCLFVGGIETDVVLDMNL